ncbi:hypothetical protein [Planococcus sp. S3-L1]|uniref:hypothetical protein n=1 Tax=Planococcus sp. S3-L1 TaxID=3046200 RepID=UPI0024BB863C|nr:hypothetical protein [Planococcus sp. S3-L1]MDJ0333531.1 hypothetical protein [Planococcus sp. S3-L1]
MKKFVLAFLSVVLLSFGVGSSVFANEYPVEESIDLPPYIAEEGIDLLGVYQLTPEEEGLVSGLSPACGGPICMDSNLAARAIKYTKTNVKTSTTWSNFKKVSGIINGPGSISATKSEAFGVVVNGAYSNLGLSLNKTKTSITGYTLTHAKNTRVYMGYRVKYSVETGTRVATRNGFVISRLPYTVKTPIIDEYKLINYYD